MGLMVCFSVCIRYQLQVIFRIMFLLNGFLIIVFVGFVFSFVLNGVVIEGVLDDEKEVNCEKWLNFVVVLLL